jgi:hypothetical protein
MTVEELSGRALDLAVARHVFGHDVEERPNLRTGEMDAVYSTGHRTSNATWVRVPLYSRTLSATIQVEVELEKRGWNRIEPQERASGNVRVVLEHADGRTVEAMGHPEEAMCRAALKALTDPPLAPPSRPSLDY